MATVPKAQAVISPNATIIATGIVRISAIRTTMMGKASKALSKPMRRLRLGLLATVARTNMTCSGSNQVSKRPRATQVKIGQNGK